MGELAGGDSPQSRRGRGGGEGAPRREGAKHFFCSMESRGTGGIEPASRRIGDGEIHRGVSRGRRGGKGAPRREGAKHFFLSMERRGADGASRRTGEAAKRRGRPVAPRPVAANPDSHREQAGRRVPAAAGGTVSDARRRIFSKRRGRPLGDRPAGAEGTQSLRTPLPVAEVIGCHTGGNIHPGAGTIKAGIAP